MDTILKEFTPTQERILAIFSDGLNHKKEELHKAVCPDSGIGAIYSHIRDIRKILRRKGEDIVCVTTTDGMSHAYRHVRMLRSPNE